MVMAPPLLSRLLLSSVTATGPVTVTEPEEEIVTSSGWPELAVEVATGVVRASPMVVAAKAGPAASSRSGAAAAAVNSDKRMQQRLRGPLGQ